MLIQRHRQSKGVRIRSNSANGMYLSRVRHLSESRSMINSLQRAAIDAAQQHTLRLPSYLANLLFTTPDSVNNDVPLESLQQQNYMQG